MNLLGYIFQKSYYPLSSPPIAATKSSILLIEVSILKPPWFNLIIKSVQETQVGNTLYKTGENSYTAIIPLSEIQKGNSTNKITVEVEWKDDDVNNEQDVQIASEADSRLEIPITVHISQYLGEQIQWTK